MSPVPISTGKLARHEPITTEGSTKVIDGECVDEVDEEEPEEIPPSPPSTPTPPATPTARTTRVARERSWLSSFVSHAGWGLAVALLIVVVILYLTGNGQGEPANAGEVATGKVASATTNISPTTSTTNLSADVVLPIIAGCESGGRQFDDEGNLITNPTTTAVGKYQIMASLHEEKAKSLGFDIRTEAGNEAYAKYLYAENGLEDWEATRWCWEGMLLALNGLPPSTQRRIVEVGKEGTQFVPIPGGWGIRWAPERRDAKFRVEPLGGKPVDFPTEKFTLTGDSGSLRFRSLEAEPVRIQIWFVTL